MIMHISRAKYEDMHLIGAWENKKHGSTNMGARYCTWMQQNTLQHDTWQQWQLAIYWRWSYKTQATSWRKHEPVLVTLSVLEQLWRNPRHFLMVLAQQVANVALGHYCCNCTTPVHVKSGTSAFAMFHELYCTFIVVVRLLFLLEKMHV